jgi:hypothetical protein
MLWTVFKVLMVVWMLKMVLDFGASAIPIVLAVSLTALLLRLIHSSHLVQLRQNARPQEDRKVQLQHS